METRANYAIIGVFTLAVVATAAFFVFWFSGTDTGKNRQALLVVFSNPVPNLSKGSGVFFNGIRKGDVVEVKISGDDYRNVEAKVELDPDTPLSVDTKARFDSALLTGEGRILLQGGAAKEPIALRRAGVPVINAEVSADFQELMSKVGAIASRAESILDGVSRVVSENEGDIRRSVAGLAEFSDALRKNAPLVDKFLVQVSGAAERVGPLAEKMEALATDLQGLVQSVETKRIAALVQNVEGFTQTLADNRQYVAETLRDVATLATKLNESAGKLDGVLADVGAMVKSVEVARLNNTLANAESFSKTLADNREAMAGIIRDVGALAKSIDAKKIDSTLANVEGFSKTLADNRENVASILQDVASLGKRLNEAAPKLDSALTDIAALTKSIDAAKVGRTVDNVDKFALMLGNSSPDVEKALQEARSLAEKLNRSADRVDNVLKAAESFLGATGGGETQGAFGEVREAARSIRSLAENLDRRTNESSAGLTRFTNTGLREYEALATEGRRTLNDISRTVRSLERNPSQVIFGGRPNIPEYSGGRR